MQVATFKFAAGQALLTPPPAFTLQAYPASGNFSTSKVQRLQSVVQVTFLLEYPSLASLLNLKGHSGGQFGIYRGGP